MPVVALVLVPVICHSTADIMLSGQQDEPEVGSIGWDVVCSQHEASAVAGEHHTLIE